MQTIKCVLVGDDFPPRSSHKTETEKTALLIAYTNKSFSVDYIPTVFDNYAVTLMISGEPYTLGLWDTSGQADYDRLRPLSYPQTDVFIVLFSVVIPSSLENVKEKWFPEIKNHCPKTPFILVGCQTDLRDDEETIMLLSKIKQHPISFESANKIAVNLGAVTYVECSSVTREGVNNVFMEAVLAALAATQHQDHSSIVSRLFSFPRRFFGFGGQPDSKKNDEETELSTEGNSKKEGTEKKDSPKESRNVEYDEKALAEAMEEGGGDLIQSNIVLHGPPGAGKTSVKRLMIGLPALSKKEQTATNILDNAVRTICIDKMRQFEIIKNDDLIDMIAAEVEKQGSNRKGNKCTKSPFTSGDVHIGTPLANENPSASTTYSTARLATKSSLQASQKAISNTASIKSIKDSLGKKRGCVKLFDSHWHHVIDSGGQPQFQDILPLVYHSPSLNIVVIRLTDGLDVKPKVRFYEKGKDVYTLPDHLVLSNQEFIVSMCQIAVSQASSGCVVPYVMIIGSHKDVLGKNCESKVQELNQRLVGIRKEFGNVLICKSEEETIFAVNTMAGGAERQKYTKELQECIAAVTEENALPVRVPLRWLAYQLDLDKGKGVVRVQDCYEGGKSLGMEEVDVKNALTFFNKIALVLYFPEDIPDLVMTKMDPFVNRLSKLVKASFIAPKYCPPQGSERLRTKGLFHKSFLAKVFQDIKEHDLHDDEFLKLLECLKIAVHIGQDEYFLPSALSLEPSSNESVFKMHSVPLVFSWGERILPHGFFFTVAIELLNKPDGSGDYKFELCTDITQLRGEIQVREAEWKIPGVVKLTDMKKWIQLSYSGDNQYCSIVHTHVTRSIQKATERFQHIGIDLPKTGYLCPLCEEKDHYCCTSADKQFITCSLHSSKTGPVTQEMLCWIQEMRSVQMFNAPNEHERVDSPLPSLITPVDDTLLPANDDTLLAVLRSTIEVVDWFALGLALGIPSHELERIKRDGFDERDRHRRMVSLWLGTGEASWKALVQALIDPVVNKDGVAKKISKLHPLNL